MLKENTIVVKKYKERNSFNTTRRYGKRRHF